MKHLLDVRTFIFGLILAVLGVGYSIANVVVVPMAGDDKLIPIPYRMFYLTPDDTYLPTQAIGACDTGYHMASMFELLYSSGLRYDKSRGFSYSPGDEGEGPPESEDGWIRTGVPSTVYESIGNSNCDIWTSTNGADRGTLIEFGGTWTQDQSGETAPWAAGTALCNLTNHVWCVQDY